MPDANRLADGRERTVRLVVPPHEYEYEEERAFQASIRGPCPQIEVGGINDEETALHRWEITVRAIEADGRRIAGAELAAEIVEHERDAALRVQNISRPEHDAIARRGVVEALYTAIAHRDLPGLGKTLLLVSTDDPPRFRASTSPRRGAPCGTGSSTRAWLSTIIRGSNFASVSRPRGGRTPAE